MASNRMKPGRKGSGPGGRPAQASYKAKRLLSLLIVAMLIAAAFAIIKVSDNARALDFVESLPVPWPSTFTPLDSAWDDTGNHAIVVGNSTDQSSNAWHYNAASGEWGQVTPPGGSPTSQTWYVGSGAGNHSATVQGGVDLASNGDTVYVWPGTYAENVVIDKPLSVVGAHRDTTIIDAGGVGNVLVIEASNVFLSNLKVVNPDATNGRVIYIMSVGDCVISNMNLSSQNRGIDISLLSTGGNIIEDSLVSSKEGISISGGAFNTVKNCTLQGTNEYSGIIINGGSDNLVENCTIEDFYEGVYLTSSNSNTIRRNLFRGNDYGVYTTGSNGIFYKNNFISNTDHAYDEGTNTWTQPLPVGGNHWDDWTNPDANADGIVDNPRSISGGGAQDSSPWAKQDGWIKDVDNTNTGAKYLTIQAAVNAALAGHTLYVWPGTYNENVVINKQLTLLGAGASETIIDGGGIGRVVSISANSVTVKGFTIQNSGGDYVIEDSGVHIRSSDTYSVSNSRIENNIIRNNLYGVFLRTSVFTYPTNNHQILNNSIHSNGRDGIYTRLHCYDNIISGNTINNNGHNGIHLYDRTERTSVFDNVIYSNTEQGINVHTANSNTLYRNTIYSNSQYGVQIFNSNSNILYHNNILANGAGHAIDYDTNNWHNGYPSGGNYWSDWTGADGYNGANQNIAGSDGIIDSNPGLRPRAVPGGGGGQDNYPWVRQNGWIKNVVNSDTGMAYNTIQEAINAAGTLNGHTITVGAGTYVENVNVNKRLNIIGSGASNTILNPAAIGDGFYVTVPYVNISGFTISGFSDLGDSGIWLFQVSDCTIKDNHFNGNSYGLYLYQSHYNIIRNNTFTSNSNYGIRLEWNCNGNDIYWNDISNNDCGVLLTDSSSNDNRLYQNNFLNNPTQAYDSHTNMWNLSLPTGGNFWNDYAGADIDSDGIGDTPYTNLGVAGAQDNYPWVQESGWEYYQEFIYQDLTGVAWDSANKRFWLCGLTGGDSTVYYIDPLQDVTTMMPVSGAPAYSFTAIAADNLGNVLVGGSGLDALHYYETASGLWYVVAESGGAGMADWSIRGITFNSGDGRFYIVGENDMMSEVAAFFTDTVPLTGGKMCHVDTSGFLSGPGMFLNSIAWNPVRGYGLAVGTGVYRVDAYDGNVGNKLNWTQIPGHVPDTYYHDVSWDPHGWNEAAISGYRHEPGIDYGGYWRYYHSNPKLLEGYLDPNTGTEYRTCAFKPPSSPKWVLIPHSGGTVKINVEEKYEGGEITINLTKPNIFDVQMYLASDLDEVDVFNMQADAGTSYTFFLEANYTGGWNNVDIVLTAWHDRGFMGDLSGPGAWDARNRTRQFNLTYRPSTDTASMSYPLPDNGVSEFDIVSTRSEPGYGPDGSRHHVYITVFFGNQTRAATGVMNPAMDRRDPNMALNDPDTWDIGIRVYDRNVPSSYDLVYDEFGIKEYAWISNSGGPRGSAPPGATNMPLSSSFINYSTNTNHSVTVSIPDLYKDGNPISPYSIAASSLAIQNTLATVEYSDVAAQLSFTGPNIPLYIWGKSAGPVLIDAPSNGTRSAGPFTDHSEAYQVFTVLDWWLVEVPVTTPEGIYFGTITVTLGY